MRRRRSEAGRPVGPFPTPALGIDEAEVLEGLAEGEVVVLHPGSEIADGVLVE